MSYKFMNPGNLLRILLPVCISIYLMYPLLKGDYLYPIAEYELYKSFMVNFIDALKSGELPVWNEYVGGGHPALYFGHYPISQNTIIYMLFGFSDFTYYFTKLLSLLVLFFSFIYACKYFKLGYGIALLGAIVYFSINFVVRVFVAETIGNLLFVFPLLTIFTIKIIDENKAKDILLFNLFYILWLSGGHIIYVYMHLMMLSIVYLIAVIVFYRWDALRFINLKKTAILYFTLFILPFFAALYQYYFIYDVISASNRFKEGLIISPFEAAAWKQLAVSFQSSSYFWIGFSLIVFYAFLKLMTTKYHSVESVRVKITRSRLLLLTGALFFITVANVQFSSNSAFFIDYIPILNSTVFRVAVISCFIINFFSSKSRAIFFIGFSDLLIFIIYTSLLSYYFYSPENIIGDVKGYDYDLFRELSSASQMILSLCILYSAKEYKDNKIVKVIALSSIALYFIRSHFTIPLLRFTGIVWYAPRDGSIFSVFFAVLFMFGLKNIVSDLSRVFKGREVAARQYVQFGLILFILVLLVHDSFNKLYKGTSHRFIYPNKREIAKSGTENWILNAREDAVLLNNKLLELKKETNHFYRVFTPENSYIYLAGNLQQYEIHEAVIYESSISRELQDFYDFTILEKIPVRNKELKHVMPYFLFTRHVHAGLNLQYKDIAYGDFFMFSPKDISYLLNQNIELLWDIMQVKYLIIGPEFSKTLEGFSIINTIGYLGAILK